MSDEGTAFDAAVVVYVTRLHYVRGALYSAMGVVRLIPIQPTTVVGVNTIHINETYDILHAPVLIGHLLIDGG